MTRTQQQLAWLAGLLVLMALVYARAWRGTPRAAPAATAAPVVAAAPGAGDSSEESRVWVSDPSLATVRADQRQRRARLAWTRDPFTRGASMSHTSGLTLSGILWDPAQPIAMINDHMVRVGEQLEGYTILEIRQDRVSVTDGTDTFQLHVAP